MSALLPDCLEVDLGSSFTDLVGRGPCASITYLDTSFLIYVLVFRKIHTSLDYCDDLVH